MIDFEELGVSIRRIHTNSDGPVVEVTDHIVPILSVGSKVVPGKAALATDISIYLHEFLTKMGISTHHHGRAGQTQRTVFETETFPFTLLTSNVAGGELIEDFGLEPNGKLAHPLTEIFLSAHNRDGEMIRASHEHLLSFGIIEQSALDVVSQTASRINDLLAAIFFGVGVELERVQMEFGIHFDAFSGEPVIMLTSELSPDTMNLCDMASKVALDYRRAFDSDRNELVGYKEIARRLDIDSARELLSR